MAMSPIPYELDGVSMTGWLANGTSETLRPGILVAPEAPGINGHVKFRAQSLADLGYVAFALDLYGDRAPAQDDSAKRHANLMATPGLMFRRAEAALNVLAAQPGVDPDRMAAIGFCQGGITVLELARGRAPVRCAVGFHPGLQRPAGSPTGEIRAKVLMMVGDADPLAPQTDREAFAAEMTVAKADWQLHIFGGAEHAFTNPAVVPHRRVGFAYDPVAADRAWKMMIALFDECL